MIELPESYNYAKQLNETVKGKRIASAVAAFSPHKFAWYYDDPQKYDDLLRGKTIGTANGYGSMVEIKADNTVILFGDGASPRFHSEGEPRPKKHQLLIEFEDGSAISASIQMYGGLWCFEDGEFDNPYYLTAKRRTSPLTEAFDMKYFEEILSKQDTSKLSAKAFLATEQRIPGLGNGVLQDILWHAKIHPRRKVSTLKNEEFERIFNSIKTVLYDMVSKGGRDTEKDLFGVSGGYKTAMSKNNDSMICPACGGPVKKENYLGGSIYFCENCQVMDV